MSVQAAEPLPAPATLFQAVQIRMLELFIVPLAETERFRYQIHLLFFTNVGPMMSEFIIDACDKPSDWVTWSYGFRKWLNAEEPCDAYRLERQSRGNSVHSHLARAALRQLIDMREPVSAYRRTSLMARASNYICLF